MNNEPVQYCFGQFTKLDADMLGITNEQSRAQQGFEALALLIMLRLWLWHLTQRRVTIRVRGDNLGALSLLCRMQPKSPSMQAAQPPMQPKRASVQPKLQSMQLKQPSV